MYSILILTVCVCMCKSKGLPLISVMCFKCHFFSDLFQNVIYLFLFLQPVFPHETVFEIRNARSSKLNFRYPMTGRTWDLGFENFGEKACSTKANGSQWQLHFKTKAFSLSVYLKKVSSLCVFEIHFDAILVRHKHTLYCHNQFIYVRNDRWLTVESTGHRDGFFLLYCIIGCAWLQIQIRPALCEKTAPNQSFSFNPHRNSENSVNSVCFGLRLP